MKRLLFISFFLIFFPFLFAQEKMKHDVFFNTDSYSVKPTEKTRLIGFIQSIKDIDLKKIEVFGFCDDRGSDEYNLKLSNQRANTIKYFFIKYGIDSTIIKNTDGKGEILLKRIDTSNAHVQRQLNRKTEIIVSLKKENIVVKSLEEKSDNETVVKLKNVVNIGDKIILKNILFKNGYSEIIPDSKKTLDEIAEALVERDDVYFTIQGHVCCTYKTRDAINAITKKRNLSYERAKFIYNYLARRGVRKNRMKYEGLKRKFPLGGDPKFDRRVEIKITYISNKN